MKYKLGEICSIVTGSTPKTNIPEFWDGNIKWITPAELSDNSYIIEDSIRKITELAVVKTGLSSFPKGTVILSSRAPIGKVAIAGCELYCNQGFKNLICSDKIYNKYLFWYLKSKTAFLNSLGRGATFKEISKQIVANIELEVPEYLEQEKIVKRLEKLSNLLSLRHQQLEKLDLLVKSRFIEMFGDPDINPNKWPTCLIQDIMSSPASNGFFTKPADYNENGNVAIVGVADVVNRRYSNVNNLRRANATDKDFKKFNVKYGDMLFCRSSLVKEGIAKASIIPPNCNNDLLFECHVIRIPLDLNKVIPEFAQEFSTTDYFRFQMMSKSKTATMTTIGQKDIITGKLYLPPIEKQKEFLAFVQQVDKSKFVIKQSIEKLELLKSKLMQDYFG